MDFQPPRFCSEAIIFADDPQLAASASSIVGTAGEYVVTLRLPREWPVMKHVWDIDLVIARNSIRKVAPRSLVLLCPTAKSIIAFRRSLPYIQLIVANTLDELLDGLRASDRMHLKGSLSCRPNEIALGLFYAKRNSLLFIADSNAAPLTVHSECESLSDHLIVLDDQTYNAPVVAANYAFSVNAGLKVIDSVDGDVEAIVDEQINARCASQESERRGRAEAALNGVAASVQHLADEKPYEFVTYITSGFPYGYFRHEIPTSHLFSSSADETIVSSISANVHSKQLFAAVFIDAGDFVDSETTPLAQYFVKRGAVVSKLDGDKARMDDVILHLNAYPADIFFICSHCGSVGGERLTLKLPCSDGKEHSFQVDVILTVQSDIRIINGVEHVRIGTMYYPVNMDGIDWKDVDASYKKDWTDRLEGEKDVWEHVEKRQPVARIPHSTSIKISNGILPLVSLRFFDPSTNPVVFNNACVSFIDAASHLCAMGARSYIGTLASVNSGVAKEIALSFFGSPHIHQSLAVALHQAQATVCADWQERIYVHSGCHFDSIAFPSSGDSRTRQAMRVRNSKLRWIKALADPKTPGRETVQEYVEFLNKCEVALGNDQN